MDHCSSLGLARHQDEDLFWVLIFLYKQVVVMPRPCLDVDTSREVDTPSERYVVPKQVLNAVEGQGYGILADTTQDVPLEGFRPPFGSTVSTTTAISFVNGLPAVGLGDNGLALLGCKFDGYHLNNDPNNRLGLPEGFMSLVGASCVICLKLLDDIVTFDPVDVLKVTLETVQPLGCNNMDVLSGL